MNFETKNNRIASLSDYFSSKKKFIVVFLFVFAVAGGLFFSAPDAQAVYKTPCATFFTSDQQKGIGDCRCGSHTFSKISCQACEAKSTSEDCKNENTAWSYTSALIAATSRADVIKYETGKDVDDSGACNWLSGDFIKCILLLILKFVGLMLSAAAAIFEAITTPSILDLIMNNSAIYSAWQMVRDFLNLAFIFVLLYSAFCTVFQVDKYHWSKVVPNVILMALLVNFSYPITRIIIDISNVIMIYFINAFTSSGGTIADITKDAQVGAMLNSQSGGNLLLLCNVIFAFIFALTIICLALLLVARAVVLAILIIFSPIAFVGPILPGSELSSQANKWWKTLMENATFGPVMLFMVGIAISLMKAMNSSSLPARFAEIAKAQAKSPLLAEMIGQISFLSIPLIILWMGMISAKKGGAVGAGAIIGRAEKVANWAKNRPKKIASWGLKASGVSGAAKKRWKTLPLIGTDARKKRQENAEDFMYSKVFRGKTDAEQAMKKQAEEYKKEKESKSSLIDKAKNGDAAAAFRLAEDKDMDQKTYAAFIAANKDTTLHKAINGKVKQTRADIVANYNAEDKAAKADIAAEQTRISAKIPAAATWSPDKIRNYIKMESVEQEMGNLKAEKFADQDWVEIAKGPMTAEKGRAIRGAAKALASLPKGHPMFAELSKRMSPAQRSALIDAARIHCKIILPI